jgi:hypothetical protein
VLVAVLECCFLVLWEGRGVLRYLSIIRLKIDSLTDKKSEAMIS